MTTITKSIAVFDSDQHIVEPPEIWESYLDPEFRVLGKQALWRHDGETNSYLKINGGVVRDTMNPNLPRHAIWRPGMSWDAIGELDGRVDLMTYTIHRDYEGLRTRSRPASMLDSLWKKRYRCSRYTGARAASHAVACMASTPRVCRGARPSHFTAKKRTTGICTVISNCQRRANVPSSRWRTIG